MQTSFHCFHPDKAMEKDEKEVHFGGFMLFQTHLKLFLNLLQDSLRRLTFLATSWSCCVGLISVISTMTYKILTIHLDLIGLLRFTPYINKCQPCARPSATADPQPAAPCRSNRPVEHWVEPRYICWQLLQMTPNLRFNMVQQMLCHWQSGQVQWIKNVNSACKLLGSANAGSKSFRNTTEQILAVHTVVCKCWSIVAWNKNWTQTAANVPPDSNPSWSLRTAKFEQRSTFWLQDLANPILVIGVHMLTANRLIGKLLSRFFVRAVFLGAGNMFQVSNAPESTLNLQTIFHDVFHSVFGGDFMALHVAFITFSWRFMVVCSFLSPSCAYFCSAFSAWRIFLVFFGRKSRGTYFLPSICAAMVHQSFQHPREIDFLMFVGVLPITKNGRVMSATCGTPGPFQNTIPQQTIPLHMPSLSTVSLLPPSVWCCTQSRCAQCSSGQPAQTKKTSPMFYIWKSSGRLQNTVASLATQCTLILASFDAAPPDTFAQCTKQHNFYNETNSILWGICSQWSTN